MGGEKKGQKKLTREQVLALYKAGPEAILSQIEYLQETNRQLHERLQEIERQLQKNSRNSHKPPSGDGLEKDPESEETLGQKAWRSKAMAGQLTTVSKTRLSDQWGQMSTKDMDRVEKAIRVQLGLHLQAFVP